MIEGIYFLSLAVLKLWKHTLKMKAFFTLSVFLSIVACGTTYNHETKQWGYSPECVANRKDGYDPKCSDQEWNYVPTLDSQKQILQISGQALCGEDFSATPTRSAKVDLIQGDKVTGSANTDQEGKFRIITDVNSKDSSFIRINSKCGSGVFKVPAGSNGNFELGELNLKQSK